MLNNAVPSAPQTIRVSEHPPAAFALAQALQSLGVQAQARYWVESLDLPYLMRGAEHVPATEPTQIMPIEGAALEQAVYDPAIPLVMTGFCYDMQWIPPQEKLHTWHAQIAPQLVLPSDRRRGDYPLYEPYEWMTRVGSAILLVWTYH